LNAAIGACLTLLIVLVGMTQNGSIAKTPGYIASGVLAAITLGLAVARYSARKKAGE
jgi:hypothetical protein